MTSHSPSASVVWRWTEPPSGAASGEATAPPESIDVEQVLEHALRHLSWLVGDDPVVAEELRDWAGTLRSYEPEPFRAL